GGAGFGREPLEYRSDHKAHEQVDAGPQRAGHHVEEIQQPVAAVLDRENHHCQSEHRSDDIPAADRRGRARHNADDLIAHGEAPRKIPWIRRSQPRTVGAAAARVNRGPLRSLHKFLFLRADLGEISSNVGATRWAAYNLTSSLHRSLAYVQAENSTSGSFG